ncbi:MAG: hypothetical protein A2845_06295 [Candidatus Lloydbacteria bacterium RIFCSPHIGHO2_01_FULL_49_22]|uniref:Bifunctional protein FolD n=1 Tax=Candidatus Lloydbacteria bacterium RIFCSPHIGHO2_01_FULL_49_22 TaxID=1798658 RepID=A0A1G2CVV0_9BACT|nr:MAG: hypothetical protein A2845_06295 [Candidatus Lloydbacteria bacterium RIFCSPHIGHO2_01_FULL_49_22]OGZ09457.1 MAG: hypothetical protein A3C14_00490 [Candidatus Lloydbacteria bacterium RIFCSPHIGHO2_02_FULL_50_18]
MIIDGKQIANELRAVLQKSVAALPRPPVLGIVIVGDDPVIESFVRIKKKYGESLGVSIREFRFDSNISGEMLKNEVAMLSLRDDINGVVVQLPLPVSIDAQSILDAVPIAKDVDVLSHAAMVAFARGKAKIFPPVASAIQEILERHQVSVEGKEVLVLGHGRLVGKPVTILLQHNHAHVTVIDKPVADLALHVRESEIVISGVGIPALITPSMLSPNVVLIDAGTSEQGGHIVGDADPKCVDHARFFTPVPGGVGPIAVAMLFKNLVLLARRKDERPHA